MSLRRIFLIIIVPASALIFSSCGMGIQWNSRGSWDNDSTRNLILSQADGIISSSENNLFLGEIRVEDVVPDLIELDLQIVNLQQILDSLAP
jgi:hypothetical protein